MSFKSGLQSRRGYSVLETLTAVSIGMVLLSVSVRALSPVQENTAVRSADQAFRTLLAKTRSQAIERGENAILYLDAAGDSAWIERGNQKVDGFKFGEEFGVDVRTAGAVQICMTPKGLASTSCGTATLMTISFQVGSASRSLKVLPLGQVIES